MKTKTILVITFGLYMAFKTLNCFAQNIGINNTGAAPVASAALDINALNKGLLIPRLTASQRNAIASPAAGLFIFDASTSQLEYWNGSSWIQLANTTLTATNAAGIMTGRSVALSAAASPADPSAMLDIQSSTGGLLLPRMSGTQRDAISSPVAGLIIYNTSTQLLNFYSTSGWQELCGTSISSLTGAVTTLANVGINTSTPDPSAMLDVTSVTAGLAIPRLTSVQRDAILSPAQGLMLYNTTTQSINVYNGTGNWLNFVVQTIPVAPAAGANTSTQTQITWNWNAVSGANGYKYNTANNYGAATDNGTSTTYAQTGLACNTSDTLYVWAYNCSSNSSPVTLTQTTSACDTSSCSNAWTQKANYGGAATYSCTSFSIGTEGYIALGNASGGFQNVFWGWDQATNVWTQMADVGGVPRAGAVGFSIGSKGYIGTGYNANNAAQLNDFWEYDPVANTWTQKADFAGGARVWATGFSIGAEGYIGTGVGTSHYTDLWQWDQASNTWTQMANFPGVSRYYAVGFSIGTEGYIGLGYDDNTSKDDFWQWDQGTNTWTQIANLPVAGYGGAGFSIGGNGYVGTGWGIGQGFYEYTPGTNAWTQKANYPVSDGYTTGFSIGNKGYIGTGANGGQDFFEYCP